MGRVVAAGLITLGLAACADQGPTMFSLAGDYEATTFTTTEGTIFTDQLAAGGYIRLTLTANGATVGEMFVPGGGDGAGSFTADLKGGWTLVDGIVHLNHAADTFLRDMPLTVSDRRLVGEDTFSGVTVRVVLTWQEPTSGLK